VRTTRRTNTKAVIPAKAGIQFITDFFNNWTPAFAGVTKHLKLGA
jgi:hypothetical protein